MKSRGEKSEDLEDILVIKVPREIEPNSVSQHGDKMFCFRSRGDFLPA